MIIVFWMMNEFVVDLSSVLDWLNDFFLVYLDIIIGIREFFLGILIWRIFKKWWGRKCWFDYFFFCEWFKVSVESNDFVEEVLMDYIENIKC